MKAIAKIPINELYPGEHFYGLIARNINIIETIIINEETNHPYNPVCYLLPSVNID